jgi:acyl-homoserine-lactone acylase
MRLLSAVLLLIACNPEDPASPPAYHATVRWTEHGVPHITGDDYGSVGYGFGYAFARDHVCILQEQLLKVRGERARWFGQGEGGVVLDEDAGWRALDVVGGAEAAWDGLPQNQHDVLVGYADGINRWLDENAAPEPCADAGWVRHLTGKDILTYALALGLDGSGAVFVQDIGRAEPPGERARKPRGRERMEEIGHAIHSPRLGSNGWAIGGDRSENGKGLLLSNTHFPSVGEKQWFEVQLTIPGAMNVYGASLMGVPIVNVGFNEHVAWTHTVSYAPRFVAYALTLDPADPTSYAYGDGYRAMTSTDHRIEVLNDDGTVSTVTRTTWRSHYGPVIDAPIVGWSSVLAITFRDVNAQNTGMFDVWEKMNVASTLDELQAAHEVQGIPWVYTLASDDQGEAWFADTSRVPNLSDAAIDAWRALMDGPSVTGILASQFAGYGAFLVDGSDPVNEWVEDDRAAAPGVVPLEDAPQLSTRAYAFNANDSHWLANVETPLEGYNAALYGPERTARSARTRMNARYLSETGEGTASGADGKFSLAEVEGGAMSMRSSLTEVALAEVVARCAGKTEVVLAPGDAVDVSAACAALTGWDGRYTVGSAGPVVWRELLGSGVFDVNDLNAGGGGLFTTPFDPADPTGTPRDVIAAPEPGVDRETDPLLRALALAARSIAVLGTPIPTLGEAQPMPFEDGAQVGVPGGQYWEGTIGVSEWWPEGSTTLLPHAVRPDAVNETTGLSPEGWWVSDGNSFILAVSFTDAGPTARAVMTYGQSDVPTSPYLHDQAEIYATGSMRDVWFTEADVTAHTLETVALDRE